MDTRLEEWVYSSLTVSHSLSSPTFYLPASSLGTTHLLAVLPALSDMLFHSLLLPPLVAVSVL